MIGLWAYSNTIATENAHAARDVQDATTMGTRTRDDLASASPTTVRSSKAADATAITVSDVATERVSHPAAPTEPSLSPTPVRSSKADAPEIPVGDAAPEGVSHPAAPTELTVSAHVIEMLQPEGGKNKGTEGGLVSTLDHEAPVKAPAIATSSSRVSKRSLQGKYEVLVVCEVLLQANIAPALTSSSVTETLPWLEEAASLLSRPALGSFITLLWNRRNRWVHSQQLQPIWVTVTSASLLHQDHLHATFSSATSPALRPVVWSPPPSGTVTLNTDGSFAIDGGAGIGVVARDCSGRVLGGLARHLDEPTNGEFAEHAALLAGLQLGLERG
ncbi:hypothetical protein V6N11_082091 [Hibiscus sabdariffa]|uniref:RNase H type-1 domain-containing protein n=1 Tax=Hibiscus sabdariffa TaxID=183260 RepID=A0ABR2QH08_9ROSI